VRGQVIAPPATPCSAPPPSCGTRCRWCRSGDFMFCPDPAAAWATASTAPSPATPASAPTSSSASTRPCPMRKAPRRAARRRRPCRRRNHAVRAGDIALVSGPGPIGLLCLLVLAHHGINHRRRHHRRRPRLALARDLGAARRGRRATGGPRRNRRARRAGPWRRRRLRGRRRRGLRPGLSRRAPPARPYTQVGHFGRDITVPFDRIGFRNCASPAPSATPSPRGRAPCASRPGPASPRASSPTAFPSPSGSDRPRCCSFDLFERKEAGSLPKVLLRSP
jgi:hypothetical protein